MRKRINQKLNVKKDRIQTVATPSVNSDAKKALSHGAKSNLKKANKEMDFAKKQLLKGEKMLAAGDHNLAESSIFNMAGHIETTENLLNMVITNNRANPGNANVVMAFDRLKELKAKHNVFKQKVEDKAAQTASAKADAQADASALNDHWLPNPSFR